MGSILNIAEPLVLAKHVVFDFIPYGILKSGTKHLTRTCFSGFNRYPKQTDYIKILMNSKPNGALKILDIGVAQGQEPITHIQSAFELSQKSAKRISDYIDLKTVDILRYPPEFAQGTSSFDSSVVNHLKNIYDSRSGKSFWGTPIENIINSLIAKSDKQDVILFNNVLQHMQPENEKGISLFLNKLTDLVAPNGIICFTVDDTAKYFGANTTDRYKMMLDILKSKNFVEIGENSGIYKKIAK